MRKGIKSLDRQQTGLVFDKRQTNIAKGVALLLLLWHHLFYNSPEKYEMFTSIFLFRGVPVECYIADFCKVCVAIFVFLSGYGLFKSYKIQEEQHCGRKVKYRIEFIKNHLIKLMSNYWFVYIVFIPMGLFFGRDFLYVYQKNVLYGILDFFGLADMFSTPTMNETWWFMSAIIVLYIMFPIFARVLDYSPELLVCISIVLMLFPYISMFPYLGKYFIWFPPFVLGMYFARYNCFIKLGKQLNTFPKLLSVTMMAILITAFIRYINDHTVAYDSFFAISIVFASFLILSKIPFLNTVLEHLGKNSGMIFMFHTFIFSYYFRYFIYWFKYAPLIFIVMTAVCYLIAVGLEWLKKIARYDKLVQKVCR